MEVDMSRIRLAVLACLAVCALGAVSSASASAASCKEKKARWVYCIGGGVAGDTAIVGTSGPSVLRTANVEILCKKDEFKGLIEGFITVITKIIYKECSLDKPAKCTVAATLETKELSGEGEDNLAEPPATVFKGSGEKEEYITITLEGKECALKGAHTVSGKQTCASNETKSGWEEEKASHTALCKESGSKLKFGTEEAFYEGEESTSLESGGHYSIQSN
jgi:hypothetical protein